ncbi:hypothetical protein [Bacillus sp. REN16]|uniref:hypothetical protein n=1 Tax=Bacillus sp. REN16 TaxID=2887296 RepID=UPI001E4518E1|nr:hypothetical protein [Bacillus sp. REN16]MCC3358366.1 hypothetical protein [Bacillus sp. REN16]
MRNELMTKGHVLEDIDQLLSALNRLDVEIQSEVNKHIDEEGNQNMDSMKQLEKEIISLTNAFHHQKDEYAPQTEKEHSYHLTLSY